MESASLLNLDFLTKTVPFFNMKIEEVITFVLTQKQKQTQALQTWVLMVQEKNKNHLLSDLHKNYTQSSEN